MKKYKSIILLIAVIVFFNIAVAVAGYLISNRIDTLNAYRVELGAQQVALDKLSKNIIDINTLSERFKHGEEGMGLLRLLEGTYDQVSDSRKYFLQLSHGINLFSQGGTLEVGDNRYDVPPPSGEVAVLDHRIDELWQPFSAVAGSMITQFEEVELIELTDTVRFAADYVRKYSEPLGGYLDQLSDYYQSELETSAYRLRLLQIFAITFTVLFFGALTFWGLRSLIRSDRHIEKAQQETANIMKTVKEGLFLIDEDLRIASQYSAELEEILGQKRIANRELGELLSSIINQQDYETTKDFIEQLFNDDVIESLIHELNPLDRIRVFVTDENGKSEARYLSFGFSRVHDDDGKIINVLISVADVTRQIILEERIEKERLKHDEQIELLSSILSIPPATLKGFIRNVNRSCQKINEILKASTLQKGQLREKANEIFREAHGMKGEASALGLRHFVSIADELEGKVAELRQKPNLNGRDFLPLTIELDRTLELTKKIVDLHEKVGGEGVLFDDKDSIGSASANITGESQQLIRFVQEIAQRNNKQVSLQISGWSDTQCLNQHQQDKLREVIVQLLRNAVVHGIEDSEWRLASDKSAVGTIQCDVQREDDYLSVTIHDDGRGIDFERLRKKALAEGQIEPHESEKALRQKLIKYLFSSGVSTAEQQTEDAGRGVGMDVVRSRANELGAKIGLTTRQGLSTTFRIRIPIT